MAKPSRGATRFAAGKKKAKRREPQAINSMPVSASVQEADREEPVVEAAARPGGAVLQFRPRESAARSAAAKGGTAAKAALQAVDYSYVYTDLKIIGGLTVLLFGGLVALSFVIH